MGWHGSHRLTVVALLAASVVAACSSTDPFEAGEDLTVEQASETAPTGDLTATDSGVAGNDDATSNDQGDDEPLEAQTTVDDAATEATVSPQGESPTPSQGTNAGGGDDDGTLTEGGSEADDSNGAGPGGSGGSAECPDGSNAAPGVPCVTLVPIGPNGLPATE